MNIINSEELEKAASKIFIELKKITKNPAEMSTILKAVDVNIVTIFVRRNVKK